MCISCQYKNRDIDIFFFLIFICLFVFFYTQKLENITFSFRHWGSWGIAYSQTPLDRLINWLWYPYSKCENSQHSFYKILCRKEDVYNAEDINVVLSHYHNRGSDQTLSDHEKLILDSSCRFSITHKVTTRMSSSGHLALMLSLWLPISIHYIWINYDLYMGSKSTTW